MSSTAAGIESLNSAPSPDAAAAAAAATADGASVVPACSRSLLAMVESNLLGTTGEFEDGASGGDCLRGMRAIAFGGDDFRTHILGPRFTDFDSEDVAFISKNEESVFTSESTALIPPLLLLSISLCSPCNAYFVVISSPASADFTSPEALDRSRVKCVFPLAPLLLSPSLLSAKLSGLHVSIPGVLAPRILAGVTAFPREADTAENESSLSLEVLLQSAS
mmetsp:Transcript_26990/g.56789  ORF Transcript_26990/g.56789 Transcript_26990/m.56789 type:complete len:221 (+) Transcript_26990:2248-2910(+)